MFSPVGLGTIPILRYHKPTLGPLPIIRKDNFTNTQTYWFLSYDLDRLFDFRSSLHSRHYDK